MVEKLKRSNYELEQFAYISSHDLQEPLRMISLFTQLLKRRYKGNLDSDADDYIDFIVEGAKHMKLLIDDLLAYSKVNNNGGEFTEVDLDEVMKTTISNLALAIKETNANIIYSKLPSVNGDPFLLLQVSRI